MADYPAEISLFKLVGRLVKGIQDSPDADQKPELVPIVGATIIITPEISPAPYYTIPNPASPAEPLVVYQESISATTDDQGYLKVLGETQRGVYLVWGGNTALSVTGWTWRVSIRVGGGFPDRVFSIYGTPGGEFNLASLVPVPSSPGTEVAVWQQAVTDTFTNKTAAAASASAAATSETNAGNSATAAANSAAGVPAAATAGVNAVNTARDTAVAAVNTAGEQLVTPANSETGAATRTFTPSELTNRYRRITLTQNLVINDLPVPTGSGANKAFALELELKQAAGAAYTVTHPSNVVWAGGVVPPMTSTPGGVTQVIYEWNGIDKFRGYFGDEFVA